MNELGIRNVGGAASTPGPKSLLWLGVLLVPLVDDGGPVDAGTLTVAAGFTKYLLLDAFARHVSGGESLHGGRIDVRTAANGGGASLLAASALLNNLTGAADRMQSLTPGPVVAAQTAAQLFVRQTAAAAHPGEVEITLVILPLA